MNFLMDKKMKEQNKKIKEHFHSTKNKINYSTFKLDFIKQNIYVSDDVYNDVEFFNNYNKNSDVKSVYDSIKVFFKTKGSKYILKNVLQNPINNIDILNKRIDFINKYKYISNDTIKKSEKDLLVLFEENEKYIDDILNIVYFKYNILNKSSILTVYNIYRILLSPLIGILSPIIYFVVPYIIIRIKLKIKIPFMDYLKLMFNVLSNNLMISSNFKYISIICNLFTLVFYFQGIFNSIEISKTVNVICKNIILKFNNAYAFLKDALVYDDTIIDNPFFNYNFCSLKEEKEYIDSLYNENSYNFGHELKNYKYRNKKIISSIIVKSWLLDFIKSLNNYKIYNKCCFSTYVKYKKILFDNLRHPCLNYDKCIPNDFNLNNENIIITGPNKGGKSTFIKSILINILLAQTICVNTCFKFKLKPYDNILSQINIPDSKGKESLFEAEMNRCLSVLNLLKKMKSKNTIIIMDEIFNSTNVVEGISGAYSILKKMSSYKDIHIFVTTHYNYLTNLEKETNFKNYKMCCDDDIKFSYKIQEGVSTKYIALELLKLNGFDSDIIEEAIKIKELLPKI